MKTSTTALICLLCFSFTTVNASPLTWFKKLFIKTACVGVKQGSKAITLPLKQTGKILLQGGKQCGDDALTAAGKVGIRGVVQGKKTGHVLMDIGKHTTHIPLSAVSHADDLMPLVKRMGPDVLKLEAHTPGLAKQAITYFGDNAAKPLLKMSRYDAATMIKLAAKADSPKTAKLLFDKCLETSGILLKHLDTKKILAYGLTTSMITAAYKISNGVENGINNLSDKHPEAFGEALSRPLVYMVICASGILAWLVFPIRRLVAHRLTRRNSNRVPHSIDAHQKTET